MPYPFPLPLSRCQLFILYLAEQCFLRRTAPPAQASDDMSPAFPARTDATPAAADGISSQNAYPTLFRTAPLSARTIPTALYGFGSHPWPGVMGGALDGGHENSMNGISWDLM